MKKIFVAMAVMLGVSLATYAQGITYQPTYDYGYGQNAQKAQQIVRATGYYVSGYNIYKLPIRVSVYSDGYRERYVVTSYYDGHNTSIHYIPSDSNPEWPRCNASVSKTNPYSNDAMERSFMFKANVNGRYVYFDL